MEHQSVATIRARLSACPAHDLTLVIAEVRDDPRAGVRDAVASAEKRMACWHTERRRLEALASAELQLLDRGVLVVAGVDEVGRGALAGPVSAGACVLPRDLWLEGLDDSKRLSRIARERLFAEIERTAIAVAVGHAEAAEIDAVGIVEATVVAMRRALAGLGLEIGHVLVDGRSVALGVPCTAIVRGDSSVRAIAAAAIYAKVTRDALMRELDSEYPGYCLADNKGYGSPEHLAALAAMGPSPVHRRSFSPCSQPALF